MINLDMINNLAGDTTRGGGALSWGANKLQKVGERNIKNQRANRAAEVAAFKDRRRQADRAFDENTRWQSSPEGKQYMQDVLIRQQARQAEARQNTGAGNGTANRNGAAQPAGRKGMAWPQGQATGTSTGSGNSSSSMRSAPTETDRAQAAEQMVNRRIGAMERIESQQAASRNVQAEMTARSRAYGDQMRADIAARREAGAYGNAMSGIGRGRSSTGTPVSGGIPSGDPQVVNRVQAQWANAAARREQVQQSTGGNGNALRAASTGDTDARARLRNQILGG
ncbi:hypothetical protein [Actinomadura atramentaria]|uniref:hypothetical protein n=1 Tax=Actinomadura atramentaria TaxID=1990 RepID=UPI000363F141|nr:hypothetical protein [Actinomadura atramentaria]